MNQDRISVAKKAQESFAASVKKDAMELTEKKVEAHEGKYLHIPMSIVWGVLAVIIFGEIACVIWNLPLETELPRALTALSGVLADEGVCSAIKGGMLFSLVCIATGAILAKRGENANLAICLLLGLPITVFAFLILLMVPLEDGIVVHVVIAALTAYAAGSFITMLALIALAFGTPLFYED